MQQTNYDLVVITETLWDHSHAWSTAIDGCNLSEGTGKEGGVVIWLSILESALMLLSLGAGMIRLNICE